ncbi:sulfite exporter TauE/SafE family protein 3 [Arachis hypogaea]|uniref:sulfite exporter TauE/SafE family protein 3 n=1 Tax=Arachis hypogaea TaxID=3818 RepID=UPI003B211BE1
MGAALSSVHYNLKLRHPTMNAPMIDYDLALLIQPMLMLGISIGFSGTSTKAFLKGVETWKKETIMKKEAMRRLESNGAASEVEYRPIPTGPDAIKHIEKHEVTLIENVCWNEFGLLVLVWILFLAIQITKNYYTTTCSTSYWVLEGLQIPVALGVCVYEAVSLYKGRRTLSSIGERGTNFTVFQLITYCFFGVVAGVVGGLLGLGGGFIMGPLFLELGVPPQVSSATATFAMTFSSSMSVVQYYLLKRFPVPYALYFTLVATIAAVVGQHIVRRLIDIFGRASLIIFILASTIFISAVTLGGVGILTMIEKFKSHEYMGFDNLCKYGI